MPRSDPKRLTATVHTSGEDVEEVPFDQHASTVDSPQRVAILALTARAPGIPLGEIRDELGMASGVLYHHIMRLSREGLVRLETAGRRRLVYPTRRAVPSVSTADCRVQALRDSILRGETARQIAIAIIRFPAGNVATLCKNTGFSARLVYYHVKRLIDVDLVTSTSSTRHRGLRATPGLANCLANLEQATDGQG